MSALSLSSSRERKGSVALQWIGAHLLAQLVCIATALTAYSVARLFGITMPASAKAFLSAAFAIGLVTELIYVAASAWLRGAVLQQVLPRFSMTPWLIVVGGYMLAMALLTGFSTVIPADATRAAAEVNLDTVMKGLMVTTIMGAMFGLLVGSLEALVIRRAAEGAGVWIVMSMVAWSAALSLLVVSSLLLVKIDPMSSMLMMAAGFAMKLVSALVIAVLTLPALLAITPRMIEPAPPPPPA